MRTLLIAAVAFLFPLLLHGQCQPTRPLVTVTATAYEQAPADVVVIYLSVRQPYTKSLSEQNMLSNIRIETDLKFAIGGNDKVDYFPEALELKDGKYIIRKDVVITLADRRTYRETLKKLLDLEYASVSNVEFRVSQLDSYRQKALAHAMVNAKNKAQLLAQSMGQAVGAAFSISEPRYPSCHSCGLSDSLNKRVVAYDSYMQHTGDVNIAAEVTVSFDLK